MEESMSNDPKPRDLVRGEEPGQRDGRGEGGALAPVVPPAPWAKEVRHTCRNVLGGAALLWSTSLLGGDMLWATLAFVAYAGVCVAGLAARLGPQEQRDGHDEGGALALVAPPSAWAERARGTYRDILIAVAVHVTFLALGLDALLLALPFAAFAGLKGAWLIRAGAVHPDDQARGARELLERARAADTSRLEPEELRAPRLTDAREDLP